MCFAMPSESRSKQSTTEEEEIKLSRTALKIYLFLLEQGSELGPREIARALNLSPSLVYYHLRRMEELGLIAKGSSGYRVASSLRIEGFFILGRKVIPRMYVYSAFFAGLLFSELLSLFMGRAAIDGPMIVAILTSALGFAITLFEGYSLYKRVFKRS